MECMKKNQASKIETLCTYNDIWLSSACRIRLLIRPSVEGMDPENVFDPTTTVCNFVSAPSCEGSCPDKSLSNTLNL